jgi:predicted peptidase
MFCLRMTPQTGTHIAVECTRPRHHLISGTVSAKNLWQTETQEKQKYNLHLSHQYNSDKMRSLW